MSQDKDLNPYIDALLARDFAKLADLDQAETITVWCVAIHEDGEITRAQEFLDFAGAYAPLLKGNAASRAPWQAALERGRELYEARKGEAK